MLSSSLLRWGTPYLAWHTDVIMVVADALAPNGHHGISYHRNDSAMTLASNGQPNRVTDINKQCSREVGIPLYFCYWLVRFLTPMMLNGGVKSHRTHVPRNELTGTTLNSPGTLSLGVSRPSHESIPVQDNMAIKTAKSLSVLRTWE